MGEEPNTEAEFQWIVSSPQLHAMSRCGQAVPSWKFVHPTRCNKDRGHAGECDHLSENEGGR